MPRDRNARSSVSSSSGWAPITSTRLFAPSWPKAPVNAATPPVPAGRAAPGRCRRRRYRARGYTRARAALFRKIHDPAFHNEPHALEFRDVLERVSLHRDEVRVAPGRDGADLVLLPEQLRGDRGGRLDRLQRRHAVLDVVGELLRLVELGPGKTAHVRAEDDLDAFLHSALEGALLSGDHRAPHPAPRARDVVGDRDGGRPVDALRPRLVE